MLQALFRSSLLFQFESVYWGLTSARGARNNEIERLWEHSCHAPQTLKGGGLKAEDWKLDKLIKGGLKKSEPQRQVRSAQHHASQGPQPVNRHHLCIHHSESKGIGQAQRPRRRRGAAPFGPGSSTNEHKHTSAAAHGRRREAKAWPARRRALTRSLAQALAYATASEWQSEQEKLTWWAARIVRRRLL